MAEVLEVACPECGSPDLLETTLGYIGEKNPNLASCSCGWKGKVVDAKPPPMLDPGDRPTRVMPAEPSWLKVAVLAGSGIGVDRAARVLRGVILASEGPFREPEPRGEFNTKSLEMVCEMGGAKPSGLKARFGHPDMSSDALGTFVGRHKNCRMSTVTVTLDGGEKKRLKCVRADTHLAEAAFDSPKGNLADYIMTLAEEDPEALMLSLVLEPREEYRLEKDGSRKKDADGNPLPPLWYPEKLHACDFVDQGAATDSLLAPEQWAQALSVGLTPELRQALNFDNAVRLGAQVIDAVFDGQPRAVVESRLTAFLHRYLTRKYGPKAERDSISAVDLPQVGDSADLEIVDGAPVWVVTKADEAAQQAARERKARLDKLKR